MPSTANHVLLIGIDGVRYDHLCRNATPGIDAIEQTGFLQPIRVDDAGPTISGPGWATIFTGVLATDHQIMNNELSPNRLDKFPEVVRHSRTVQPDIATFVAAGWAPLVSTDSGGPLFADGGFLPKSRHVQDLVANQDDHDEQVTVASEQFVRDHDGSHGSLVVTYLGAPDEIAHELGAGETYDWSIRQADSRTQRLLTAVDQRAEKQGETWTVIVVTDHGHVDAGGHGGESEEERTAWIAARGPGIPQLHDGAAVTRGATPTQHDPEQNGFTPGPGVADLEQADVAAHTLWVLGIEPAAPAHTVGLPFGSRATSR